MVRIEVQKAEIAEKNGVIKQGDRKGESYSIRTQDAWLHNGEPYPVKVVLSISPEQGQPHAVGFYTLDATSFRAGDFDRMEITRYPVLVRDETASAAKPRAVANG